MPRSLRLPLSLLAFVGLTFATGCSDPCDTYCENTADYIEFCLETGSQEAWQDAGDWTVWGATSRDDYALNCQIDLREGVPGMENSDAVLGACEDDANRYLELTERGLCADLP